MERSNLLLLSLVVGSVSGYPGHLPQIGPHRIIPGTDEDATDPWHHQVHEQLLKEQQERAKQPQITPTSTPTPVENTPKPTPKAARRGGFFDVYQHRPHSAPPVESVAVGNATEHIPNPLFLFSPDNSNSSNSTSNGNSNTTTITTTTGSSSSSEPVENDERLLSSGVFTAEEVMNSVPRGSEAELREQRTRHSQWIAEEVKQRSKLHALYGIGVRRAELRASGIADIKRERELLEEQQLQETRERLQQQQDKQLADMQAELGHSMGGLLMDEKDKREVKPGLSDGY